MLFSHSWVWCSDCKKNQKSCSFLNIKVSLIWLLLFCSSPFGFYLGKNIKLSTNWDKRKNPKMTWFAIFLEEKRVWKWSQLFFKSMYCKRISMLLLFYQTWIRMLSFSILISGNENEFWSFEGLILLAIGQKPSIKFQ